MDQLELFVNVKPNSKKVEIFEKENELFISLTSKPIQGKANQEMISLIKEYYKKKGKKIKNIFIITGETSRKKKIRIEFF
ncbi:MAG: DUF167 family protein [Candidatus Woesearchaeota archaeon]